ncbi:NusG domain II-containing protein [Candidatus Dactylopiibacterium carminicum]|uniref:NusG domain II-containing protein n=1 Tax=Candidatus Dactylopiibacterium carminicum TaxID=857335 RepID=UPI001CC2FE1A|nr:NusG domain II-containing protein [Candidatus Dactylopiibacterium carminicum]
MRALHLLRAGDWLVLLVAIVATLAAARSLWRSDVPEHALVRLRGEVVARLSLDKPAEFRVRGPLGETLIEVQPGRARVAIDPGPRQYCVKQGWLTRAGAVAICAPNEISLQLDARRSLYDSLVY